jgi:hypothetical protein
MRNFIQLKVGDIIDTGLIYIVTSTVGLLRRDVFWINVGTRPEPELTGKTTWRERNIESAKKHTFKLINRYTLLKQIFKFEETFANNVWNKYSLKMP